MENADTKPLLIQTICAARTYSLRHAVLRPHQRLEQVAFPEDGLTDTIHLGAFEAGGSTADPIGIVTLFPEPMPEEPAHSDFRLRGMAVSAAWQGRGVGSVLIQHALSTVAEAGGRRVWCNARVSAMGFYQRAGFVGHGERFDIAGIGPHLVMSIAVNDRSR